MAKGPKKPEDAERLKKVPPGESVQKNIRIPGHLWNKIVDAIEFEGYPSFAAYALPALTARVRKSEEEKSKPAG